LPLFNKLTVWDRLKSTFLILSVICPAAKPDVAFCLHYFYIPDYSFIVIATRRFSKKPRVVPSLLKTGSRPINYVKAVLTCILLFPHVDLDQVSKPVFQWVFFFYGRSNGSSTLSIKVSFPFFPAKRLKTKALRFVVRFLSGTMSAFCTGACQPFVASNTCMVPAVPATLQQ
jgi:hypothetical protein